MSAVYVRAAGDALKMGTAGEDNTFLLTVARPNAELLFRGLSVHMKGKGPEAAAAAVVHLTVTEVGVGRVEVTYNTDEPGLYQLTIKHQNKNIAGSPVMVAVR